MHQSFLGKIRSHLLDGGWFLVDVRPPAQLDSFGKPGESSHEVIDYPDGSVVFETNVWCDIEDERLGRCWNKFEKYVDGKRKFDIDHSPFFDFFLVELNF